jgi:hypothetical protein
MALGGDARLEDAAVAHWARQAALWLPVGLGLLLVIAMVGVLIDPVHDKRQFTAFLFVRQDLIVAIGLALLIRVGLVPGRTAPSVWTAALAQRPWLVALGLLLVCRAGQYWLLAGHDLTRDEQMAHFDATIFAAGRLNWPIAPDWRPMADALNQFFILPIADRQAWVSAYLPVHAAARAVLETLGDEALTSPLFTAIGALALWRIAVRLWPDDASARAVALLLYAGSSQVVIQGMTAHAMAAHLALNLVWLALFLRGGAWSHAGAILIGFLATGLHQPLFHPLFVLPFLIMLVAQRRWRPVLGYGAAYLAIGLFWLRWPHLAATWAGGPMQAISATGDRLGYADRILAMLRDLGPVSLWLMAMNLLRFVAWQHLLALPLAAAAVGLAWRAPLVRPLLAGILLHIGVIGVLLAFQGHGWGYRYLHGVIGSLCLLGAQGWHSLRGRWPGGRLWIWGNAATFLLLLPLHGWMAARLTLPYAQISAAIDRMPAAIVVVDEGAVAFGSDLVVNRADLSNRPIRLMAGSLTLDQMAALCRTRSVAFIGADRLAPIRQMIDAQPGDAAHFRTLQARCAKAKATRP